MHLSALFIYPVKSLRGFAVPAASLDELGLEGDRRFMVVDPEGRFLTQRTLPRMALIATVLTRDTLTLAATGAGQVHIPRHGQEGAPLRTVSIWSSEGLQAEDCGDEPAQWLGDFLGTACRLVRIGRAFHRSVDKPGKSRPDDVVSFADAYPLLVIAESSLTDLNRRLVAKGESPVPMHRFRPNLVIDGCAAYSEDNLKRFSIGDAVFRAGGPCARCVITTTDQFTAERGKEPLRLLATYRRDAAKPGEVNFGQNLFHETKRATVRVGDPVEAMPAGGA